MMYDHWNSASMLPPVGCPLVIRLGCGAVRHVERTSHLRDRNGEMEYRELRSRLVYKGRLPWTYP